MRNSRHAFTLIEVMIAIALGLVLIYTATAGLRVAAQTVTVANRLALENAIVRNGFEIALDEVDFWRAYDEPVDANRQVQRAPGGIFCPFKDSEVKVRPVAPETSQSIIIDFSNIPSANDTERGWDAEYTWPVADPRTWWRDNMVERSGSDLRFGRYGRFAAIDIGAAGLTTTATAMPYTWLANQNDRLVRALGFYGMADYLPAGTIYGYVGGGFGVTSGGMSQQLGNAGTDRFQNGDGGANFAQSLYRATKNTAFAVYPLVEDANLAGGQQMQPTAFKFRNWNVGQGATIGSMQGFQSATLSRDPVLVVRPATWPSLEVATARTLAFNRFACVARVHWSSPLTGSAAELSFTCFGTTLRGARQQRRVGAGSGWAAWHSNHNQPGGDPDQANPNDPNLDNGTD